MLDILSKLFSRYHLVYEKHMASVYKLLKEEMAYKTL